MKYKYVSPKDIQQVIIGIYLSSRVSAQDLQHLADLIAKLLDSENLSYNLVPFPNENYTLTAILSTSHIAISSYFNDEKREYYLDVDVVWCSGKSLDQRILEEELKKLFENKILKIDVRKIR